MDTFNDAAPRQIGRIKSAPARTISIGRSTGKCARLMTIVVVMRLIDDVWIFH
jgi:hypothetical protein